MIKTKLIIGAVAACMTINVYQSNTLYSLSTIVTDIDTERDIVTVEELNGSNVWTFYGVEDWEVNDICSLTMFNNNTPKINDDIIIGTTYGGNFEAIFGEWD